MQSCVEHLLCSCLVSDLCTSSLCLPALVSTLEWIGFIITSWSPTTDVVTLEKSADQFRLLYNTKGRYDIMLFITIIFIVCYQ